MLATHVSAKIMDMLKPWDYCRFQVVVFKGREKIKFCLFKISVFVSTNTAGDALTSGQNSF